LENPSTILAGRADEIRSRISLARALFGSRLDRAADEVGHLGRRVRSLSPLAALERGYAVVQDAEGTIVREPEQSTVGQPLSVRVAGGRFGVERTTADPYQPPAHPTAPSAPVAAEGDGPAGPSGAADPARTTDPTTPSDPTTSSEES